MKLFFTFLIVTGSVAVAEAGTCTENLAAAKEIIRLAEVEKSAFQVKYRCEHGMKEKIVEATDLCDFTAYKENVNIDRALAYCQRMEGITYEKLTELSEQSR